MQASTAWSHQPQVLLVLAATTRDGRDWVKVRLGDRPHTAAGWIPRDHTRLGHTSYWVEVRRHARRVTVGWHMCRRMLASCDMKTLYLRNVPDDVSEGLATLAAREGLSVSAFAVRELTESARRAENAALLGELPDLDVRAEDVVADIEGERARR